MLCFVLLLALCFRAAAQSQNGIRVKVTGEGEQPLAGATAELLSAADSTLQKIQLTDSQGLLQLQNIAPGQYRLRIRYTGYRPFITGPFAVPAGGQGQLPDISLSVTPQTLDAVTVSARKLYIESKPGKTVVNLEAGISNAGATVLEALEKLPGITVDKDGALSLNGRSGVTVLLDGRQTYLDAAQLASLLAGMNAAQLSQVEIMPQPPAEFDAAGNAGIINLKLKKGTQRGFHGSMATTYSQGFYPKNNHSLQLNFRSGALNWFLQYGANAAQNFTRIEALRTYFKPDGATVASQLEQPSFLRGRGFSQNLRTGVEYAFSPKTTVGLVLNGFLLRRSSSGNNTARWLNAARQADSIIQTHSQNQSRWRNGGLNLNLRHTFDPGNELVANADLVGYCIGGEQFFENKGIFPTPYTETAKAHLPATIRIFSAKADYSRQRQSWTLKAGAKASRIQTDNLAAYAYLDGAAWLDDNGRTNHFLYTETIQAVYGNAETMWRKWIVQGGLRYEATQYNANQLGNAGGKDSAFSRSYAGFFPSAFARYKLDSAHAFSVSAGRRIDRPPFQELNPFLFIINKYTYQQGNPYYRPQYTWNFELSHQYQNRLTTGLAYSVAHDYFSQVFPVNSNGIVIYTVGNLKRLQTWGASVAVQTAPASWWSLSTQANVIRKKMEGFIEKDYKATVTQGSLSLNNQFRFRKGWSAECSGFYTSRSQHDIQEVVDPAGQLTLGLAKAVLQNRGTIRLAARDLFYTQWMKGWSQFRLSNEYFKLTRDTRLVSLSFSYRFGKTFKAAQRSEGAAGEEINRVGQG